MKIELVDCFDSFSWNLAAALSNHGDVVTTRVDALEVERASVADLLVLGPGPGTPDHYPALFALLERRSDRPVFGVCLGFQAQCLFEGGRLKRGAPVHGMTASLLHDGGSEFRDVPQRSEVMRYHSLIIEEVGRDFEVCATTPDGITMAARHTSRPWFGVQFHPESVASQDGARLIDNVIAGWVIAGWIVGERNG